MTTGIIIGAAGVGLIWFALTIGRKIISAGVDKASEKIGGK